MNPNDDLPLSPKRPEGYSHDDIKTNWRSDDDHKARDNFNKRKVKKIDIRPHERPSEKTRAQIDTSDIRKIRLLPSESIKRLTLEKLADGNYMSALNEVIKDTSDAQKLLDKIAKIIQSTEPDDPNLDNALRSLKDKLFPIASLASGEQQTHPYLVNWLLEVIQNSKAKPAMISMGIERISRAAYKGRNLQEPVIQYAKDFLYNPNESIENKLTFIATQAKAIQAGAIKNSSYPTGLKDAIEIVCEKIARKNHTLKESARACQLLGLINTTRANYLAEKLIEKTVSLKNLATPSTITILALLVSDKSRAELLKTHITKHLAQSSKQGNDLDKERGKVLENLISKEFLNVLSNAIGKKESLSWLIETGIATIHIPEIGARLIAAALECTNDANYQECTQHITDRILQKIDLAGSYPTHLTTSNKLDYLEAQRQLIPTDNWPTKLRNTALAFLEKRIESQSNSLKEKEKAYVELQALNPEIAEKYKQQIALRQAIEKIGFSDLKDLDYQCGVLPVNYKQPTGRWEKEKNLPQDIQELILRIGQEQPGINPKHAKLNRQQDLLEGLANLAAEKSKSTLISGNERNTFFEDLQNKDNNGYAPAHLIKVAPQLSSLYDGSAHVWEGYTVGRHTELVLQQYDTQKQFWLQGIKLPDGEDPDKFMKCVILLHDIGKSIKKGNQHAYTLPILRQHMGRLGFSKEAIHLAGCLVSHDLIGNLIRRQYDIPKNTQNLKDLVKVSGINTQTFLKLQILLYISDASSYPTIKERAFKTDDEGKLWLKGFSPGQQDPEPLIKILKEAGIEFIINDTIAREQAVKLAGVVGEIKTRDLSKQTEQAPHSITPNDLEQTPSMYVLPQILGEKFISIPSERELQEIIKKGPQELSSSNQELGKILEQDLEEPQMVEALTRYYLRKNIETRIYQPTIKKAIENTRKTSSIKTSSIDFDHIIDTLTELIMQEARSKDYVPFYHGLNSQTGFVYKIASRIRKIIEIKGGMHATTHLRIFDTLLSEHTKNETAKGINKTAIRGIMDSAAESSEAKANKEKRSNQIYGYRPDEAPNFADRVISANLGVFNAFNEGGSHTLLYFLKSSNNQGYEKSKDFIEQMLTHCLKISRPSELLERYEKLVSKYSDLAKGDLLQILIHKDKVDEVAAFSKPGGYPSYIENKGMHEILQDEETKHWRSYQARVYLNPVLFDDTSKVKIKHVHATHIDTKAEAEIWRELDQLISETIDAWLSNNENLAEGLLRTTEGFTTPIQKLNQTILQGRESSLETQNQAETITRIFRPNLEAISHDCQGYRENDWRQVERFFVQEENQLVKTENMEALRKVKAVFTHLHKDRQARHPILKKMLDQVD